MSKLKETLEIKVGKASEQVMLQYSKQETIDKKELRSLIEVCAKNMNINLSNEDIKTLESKYSQVVADTMNVADIKPLVDSILNVIEDVDQKRKANEKAIKPGDVVSVPFGSKYMCGIVKSVSTDKLTLDNYKNSEIEVPNNNKVYRFFPGQKFDAREFDKMDVNSPEYLNYKSKAIEFLKENIVSEELKNKGILIVQQNTPEELTQKLQNFLNSNKNIHPGINLSPTVFKNFNEFVEKYKPTTLKERLDKYLSKTDVGSFYNFVANYKSDLIQLLKGQMTHKLFNGQSIVQNPEGKQELKNWSCKFQLYRGNDGNLKLNSAWKQEKLQTKVYGVELTPEQLKNTMEKNQSVVIERETKEGKPFKAFCKYDMDLNSFVTSQYDEKIAERMKASYSKKEEQAKTQKEAPVQEQKQSNKRGKGRGI